MTNNILNDISILALKVSALENSEQYQIQTRHMLILFKTVLVYQTLLPLVEASQVNILASVYDAITNITAGWHGGGTNTTGDINPAAGSYQGVDGVTRSKGLQYRR